jgi:hypothetical protein
MVSGQAGAARASEKRFAPELVPGRSVSAEHLAQLRTLPGAEIIPSCAPESERDKASERGREREILAQGIATICTLAMTPGRSALNTTLRVQGGERSPAPAG